VLILMIYNKLRPRRRRAAPAGEPVEATA
jgi:hypothetical protein